MEQSAGADFTDRLMEAYQSAKTGSNSIARDWQKFIDLVDEAQADDELKNDVVGNLNAKGLSIQKVKDKVAVGKKIRDAIVAEFPNAIPIPEEE